MSILFSALAEKRLLQLSLVGNTQFLTALGAAAGQYFAPISCLHAFTETVNGFAAFAMRLKCTFHNYFSFSGLPGLFSPG
jgi:hypothetical protein